MQAAELPAKTCALRQRSITDRYSAAEFLPSAERSLKDLRTDYVDLLLLHWPPVGGNVALSLKLLAEAKNTGLARSIGVSNYTARMMREAAKAIDMPLATTRSSSIRC